MPVGSIDAVLLLGPLYHLASEHERTLAIRECRRVLRPGGLLFAAVISRYLSLLDTGTTGRLSDDLLPAVKDVVSTGRYDGHVGFVPGHWHTAEELEAEVRSCGFGDVAVYGVEGPAWPTLDALEPRLFDSRRTPRYGALASSSKIPSSSTRAPISSPLRTPDLPGQLCANRRQDATTERNGTLTSILSRWSNMHYLPSCSPF